MSNYITIQPGQPGEGMGYNVHKPLPYPFHVDTKTGDVIQGPPTEFDDWRLLGFQPDVGTQSVELTRSVWLAGDVDACVGMVPVFIDSDGGMFSLDVPITKTTDWSAAK